MNQTGAWDAGWYEQSAAESAVNQRQRCPGSDGLRAPLRSSGGNGPGFGHRAGRERPLLLLLVTRSSAITDGCQGVPRSPVGLKEVRLPGSAGGSCGSRGTEEPLCPWFPSRSAELTRANNRAPWLCQVLWGKRCLLTNS